ncbi:MAG: aromatic amino acid transport family protein [Candidatus Omnitrophota bacterium]
MLKKISAGMVVTIALLITGNLVGAGILGLPVQAGLDGFIPTLVGMLIVAGAMFFTAIILGAEAVRTRQETFNYPSLYHEYLGFAGKWIAIIANLLILYGLLTAYLTGATTIIVNLLPFHVSSTGVLLLFFLVITALAVTGLKGVRKYNVLLMLLMWVSFAIIVIMAEKYVVAKRLMRTDWGLLPLALPVIITSFHFHNIIPNICRGLKWDMRVISRTMLLGLVIGYLMNAIWTQVGIGALPVSNGDMSLVYAFQHSFPATVPLAKEVGSPLFSVCALLFALLAITTSYLANGIGLTGFIRDLTENHFGLHSRFAVITLSFGPPLVISLIWPDIFLKALSVVGGIGIVILFGILPSVIARKRARSAFGKIFSTVVLVLFSAFLVYQLGEEAGLITSKPDIEKLKSSFAAKDKDPGEKKGEPTV